MAENMNVTAVPPQAQQAQQTQPQADVRNADNARAEVPKAQAPDRAQAAKEAETSVEELQAAIEKLNDFMREGQRSLAFSVDRDADEVVVQVRDKQTNELVRQIPSPEALELKQHLDGVIGLLFNDKA